MLGRTANGLYWMFRYIERAENIARLVDAGQRMSLTRSGAVEDDWDGVLQSAGVREAYDEVHSKLTGADAIDYLMRDRSNPSSVMSCIEYGRNNARMVRTALTRDTWEATNECWIELKALLGKRLKTAELPETIDVIKRRAGLIRGAFHGSMLRNELYNFARMGTFIERADNTARILDTKYHILLPSVADVGGAVDYYQWASLLQSLSGFEAYRKIYSDVISPRRIAELLILRDDMPRSLHSCMNFIHETLQLLCDAQSREIERQAGAMHARIHYGRTDDIMDFGLHEYLIDFLEHISRLGAEVSKAFLVPV